MTANYRPVRVNDDIGSELDIVVADLKRRRHRNWSGTAVINIALRHFFERMARMSDKQLDQLFAEYEQQRENSTGFNIHRRGGNGRI